MGVLVRTKARVTYLVTNKLSRLRCSEPGDTAATGDLGRLACSANVLCTHFQG